MATLLTRLRPHLREIAPLATLVILYLFFAITARGFFSLSTLTSILEQVPTRLIVGTGLTFVLLCAEIDLSVAMIATFSACQMGVIYKYFSDQPISLLSVAIEGGAVEVTLIGVAIAILIPLVVGLLLGLANGALTVWSALPSFIITLAMMQVARGLAGYITKSQQFPVPGALKTVANESIGLFGGLAVPLSLLLALFIMLIAHIVLTHTRFGRYVYMVGGNREAARLSGVRTGLIVAACLAICGLAGAMGGLMNAGWINSAGINQNEKLLLEAVACVVLGGTSLFGGEGGIRHTLVGVLAFTVLDVGLGYITWVDEFLRPFVLGFVLMCALVLNGQLAKLHR